MFALILYFSILCDGKYYQLDRNKPLYKQNDKNIKAYANETLNC